VLAGFDGGSLRVPHEGKAGARRQEVRTFATLTRRCWNYRTG
jgi:hypothetical protein